jgi:F-type H+-transporting ATPase subunit delta
MDTISTRYAKALIELAIEENKVSDYQSQMKFVHSVILDNSELVTFLKHNSIKDNDKKDLISKIFKDNVNVNVLHFIYLLIDKKRINYLSQICRDFNSECNNYRGILEGVIYSTEVLTNEKIEKLERSVSLKLNNKVELSNSIDPSLIGGLKIVVNDTVFDNSVVNRINSLRQELINGKDVR